MNSVGRCRVRDLVASCFNTCRLPLDEEPSISGSEPPPKTSNQSVSSKKEDAAAVPSVQTSSHNTGGGGGGGGGGGDGERAAEVEPRFADEDYIVFCFGEDGEIHMMNDTKSSEKICSKKGQKRTTSEEAAAAATSQPCSSSSRKGEVDQSKMDSFESCDSNLSDSSTSSFAFPVVGMEWIGSPAHMPNTEKRDGAAACRRCCKF